MRGQAGKSRMWNEKDDQMKRSLFFRLAVPVSVLACLSVMNCQRTPTVAKAGGDAGSKTAVRTVEVGDPALQMRAGTLEIPADWKFAGIVYRERGCHSNGAQVKYYAQSADGLTAIQVFPGNNWRDTTSPSLARIMAQNDCPPVGMSTPQEYLKEVVLPNLRPTATLDRIDPLFPADEAMVKANLEKMQENAVAQARKSVEMGFRRVMRPDQHTLEGAIARIHYTLNGHEVEETVGTVVHCADVWVPGNYVAQPSVNHNCNSYPVVVLRAPRGTLDGLRPRLLATKQTYRVESAWDFRMGQIIKQQSDQAIAASNAQFNQMQQNSQTQFNALMQQQKEMNAARQQSVDNSIATARAQQDALDASAHATALWALDKGTYVNPQTGLQYEISNQYAHQYISSDETTVYHTNDTFNPNGATPGTSWTELQPK